MVLVGEFNNVCILGADFGNYAIWKKLKEKLLDGIIGKNV